MPMYRVSTMFTGPQVVGGGFNSLYWDIAAGSAADAHSASVTFWENADPTIHTSTTISVLGEIETVDEATGVVTDVTSVATETFAGTAASDPLPNATQALIRLRSNTFVGSREVRGRIFIPAQVEVLSTNGVPTAGLVSGLDGAAATMLDAPEAQLVVYSRTHNLMAPVSSVSTWSQWASLRSRRD